MKKEKNPIEELKELVVELIEKYKVIKEYYIDSSAIYNSNIAIITEYKILKEEVKQYEDRLNKITDKTDEIEEIIYEKKLVKRKDIFPEEDKKPIDEFEGR